MILTAIESATSKVAGREMEASQKSAKRNADGRDFGTDNLTESDTFYRSSLNMADELLQQAQELFEGQIVGRCPVSRPSSNLTLCLGFRRAKADRIHIHRSSSCLRCTPLHFSLFVFCAEIDINVL